MSITNRRRNAFDGNCSACGKLVKTGEGWLYQGKYVRRQRRFLSKVKCDCCHNGGQTNLTLQKEEDKKHEIRITYNQMKKILSGLKYKKTTEKTGESFVDVILPNSKESLGGYHPCYPSIKQYYPTSGEILASLGATSMTGKAEKLALETIYSQIDLTLNS